MRYILGDSKTMGEGMPGYRGRHPTPVRDKDGPMDGPRGCRMGGSQNTDREAHVKRRVRPGTGSEQDRRSACAGLEEVGSRHSDRQLRLAGRHERAVPGSAEAGVCSLDMEGAHDVQGWPSLYRRLYGSGGSTCSEESAVIFSCLLGS